MAIPQLETCCCGCTLKTGTKIIGWLSLISGILMLIVIGTGLTALYYIEEHPDITTPEAEEIRKHLPALKALSIFMVVVHVFSCALSFILLLGAYQNKAKLILFWVVVYTSIIVIETALNVVQMLTVYQSNGLISLLLFFIDLYFVLVVYSFYREIRNVSTYP